MDKSPPLEDSLWESFSRWNYIYQNGSNDPFWTDGLNLNLVRNHIIYYKRKIEDETSNSIYPDIYYQPTPPEVDCNFMAKTRKLVCETLQRVESSRVESSRVNYNLAVNDSQLSLF